MIVFVHRLVIVISLLIGGSARAGGLEAQFGVLPGDWKGLSCEGIQFFHSQYLAALEEDEALWNSAVFAELDTKEFERFSVAIQDKISVLRKVAYSPNLLKIEVPGVASKGEVLGLLAYASGVHYLTPNNSYQFYLSQIKNDNLQTSLSLEDVCLKKEFVLQIFKDCKLPANQTVLCKDENDLCMQTVEGFHPKMCRSVESLSVDLTKIKAEMKKTDRVDDWEG